MKKKKPLPVATRVYFQPRDRARLSAAAKSAGKPVSGLIRGIVLDHLDSRVMEDRLLASQAFRSAMVDVMSRPDVVQTLAVSLKRTTPAQLGLFKREIDRVAGAWAKGAGKG